MIRQFFFIIFRLFLGGIFIFASIDKIIHPLAFAKVIYNFQVLPDTLINLTAIVLPWLELVLGVFLIVGVWLPGAVLLCNLLLLMFFGSLVFNLARGLDVYCGCFSATDTRDSGFPMAWYVVRDGLFLLPAFYLFSHFLRGKKQAHHGVRL